MDRPKVSVCMIAFNHEKYIAQAIKCVLDQKTDFPNELVIANDASTDGTHKIIEGLAKGQEGFNVKYYNHPNNLGIINNFIFALKKCKGDYIALCEGDDYWIDPLKLQKQVDFMEANPNFSGIATQSQVIYEGSSKNSHLFRDSKLDVLRVSDVLGTRLFHTATFLFRAQCFKNDFPPKILSGDRALFMLVACFGPIKFFSEVTAVYRKNEGGISKRVTSEQMKRDYKIVPFIAKYNQDINIKKLKAFIAYTVLDYSHQIFLFDFLKASMLTLLYSNFNYKNRRIVKKAFKKIRI